MLQNLQQILFRVGLGDTKLLSPRDQSLPAHRSPRILVYELRLKDQ